MPAKFNTALPVKLTSAQPTIITTSPGTKRSLLVRPPSPYARAFGGVLITNGIPNEDAIAIRSAVDGSGNTAVAIGIKRTAVAVLLISAESSALERQRMNRTATG